MINKVIMQGNIANDITVKNIQENKSVANFNLAVGRRAGKGTDFFSIVAWGSNANFAEKYFKKGQQIVVVGKLENRSWEDSNGQKRYSTEIIAEEFSFCGKKEEEAVPVKIENGKLTYADGTLRDDELPF